MEVFDTIVIGGGPAGLTALLYLGRGLTNSLLLEGFGVGGQVILTDTIENYAGFPGGIAAFELVERMEAQAREFCGRIETLEVQEIIDIDKPLKTVVCSTGETFGAKAIIIASGAKARKANVHGEEEFKARGVSYCGTCDGAFFKDKVIATLGGGDTCFDETVFLSRFAKKIYLIHRRQGFRAAPIAVDRVKKIDKVEFVLDTVIDEIIGTKSVEGVNVRNVITNEKKTIALDGVFVFVGLDPTTAFLKNSGIAMSSAGYIMVNPNMETNIKGIYAAGDVTEKSERQIATAVGDATIAACQVIKYLDAMK
ncbi:MAG: FAD-dependent oxidoreductase [Spirochaetes bacterium]|nr:FAD-dependent oxidoreductase [Spirochaetota bacterium]